MAEIGNRKNFKWDWDVGIYWEFLEFYWVMCDKLVDLTSWDDEEANKSKQKGGTWGAAADGLEPKTKKQNLEWMAMSIPQWKTCKSCKCRIANLEKLPFSGPSRVLPFWVDHMTVHCHAHVVRVPYDFSINKTGSKPSLSFPPPKNFLFWLLH